MNQQGEASHIYICFTNLRFAKFIVAFFWGRRSPYMFFLLQGSLHDTNPNTMHYYRLKILQIYIFFASSLIPPNMGNLIINDPPTSQETSRFLKKTQPLYTKSLRIPSLKVATFSVKSSSLQSHSRLLMYCPNKKI